MADIDQFYQYRDGEWFQFYHNGAEQPSYYMWRLIRVGLQHNEVMHLRIHNIAYDEKQTLLDEMNCESLVIRDDWSLQNCNGTYFCSFQIDPIDKEQVLDFMNQKGYCLRARTGR